MSASDDDFFNSGFSSPPKQSASLATSTAGGTSSSSSQGRRAPPPPPRRTGPKAATTTQPLGGASASSTTSTSVRARKGPAATSSSATGSGVSIRRPLPTTKANPTMRPPVTNYYGGSGGSSTAPGTTDVMDWSTQSASASSAQWSNPTSSASVTDWSAGGSANKSKGAEMPSTSDWYSVGSNDVSQSSTTAAASAGGTGFYGAPQQQHQANQFQPSQVHNQSQNNSGMLTNMQYSAPGTSSSMQGSMDQQMQPQQQNLGQGLATPGVNIMNPQNFLNMASSTSMGSLNSSNASDEDYSNEPPLLEELGIHFDHIAMKTKAVILPFSRFQTTSDSSMEYLDPQVICKEADLAGPLAFCLLLGAEMVFMGKLQFGYIYGFGLFGCISMTLIANLMSPTEPISIWTVTSILGYALLPVNVLAVMKVFFMNQYTGINFVTLGRLLALVTVAWSTTASTRLLEVGCGLRDQRYLLAYPIALLYSAFVLITIF